MADPTRRTPAEDGGYRHVLRLVVPMVLSNAAFTVMQFTDRVLVARFSSESIQAAMPAGILTFCLLSLFAATAGYAGTFVAQYHGAGDRRATIRSCAAGVWLTVLFLPFFALLMPLCSWILSLAARDPALFALEDRYAFWMLLGAPLVSLHWVLSGYLTGRNRVVANALVTVAGCAVNVALDVWLVFGGAGVPALGLEGAGIATFASVALQDAILVAVILAEREVRALPRRELLRPDWGLVRRIVRFGLPAGVQLCFDMASFSVFVLLTGRLDDLSLATSNVAFSINNLAFAPLMGFSNVAAILAGQFQGAEKPRLAQSSVMRCLRLAWVYMALCAAVFLLLPETLLGAFRSPDAPYTAADMAALGRSLLAMLAAWGMFDTMNVVFLGALKGAGDTRFAMAWLLGTEWAIYVPAVAIVMILCGGGIVDAWWIQLLYVILLSSGLYVRWRRGKWMSIKLVGSSFEAGVSLGSNLGDRAENLRRAVRLLAETPGVRLLGRSAIYETEPVDVPSEFAAQDYLNAVAVFDVSLPLADWSARCHAVEDELGRVRTGYHHPRTIDVDLLYCGETVRDEPHLHLPHPQIASRRFVCEPLAELRPGLRLPGLPDTVAGLLAALPPRPAVRPSGDRWDAPPPPAKPPA